VRAGTVGIRTHRSLSRAIDLVENVDHLAGTSMVGPEGLVVFGCPDLLREEETASVADDSVWRRLEDDGERLDPAQFLVSEPDRDDLLQFCLAAGGGRR